MQAVHAVVDLKKIAENARNVRRCAGRPLIAVVKDDAYGHGAEQVAHALSGIAEGFAVATVREGAALRIAGITAPILVLTPPLDEEDAEGIFAYHLTAAAGSLRAARLIRSGTEVHIAVNTGMNRYGVRPERTVQLCEMLVKKAFVTGIFSHLYAPQSPTALAEQTSRFRSAVRLARSVIPGLRSHLGASGGLFVKEGELVRAGLALYGYLPADASCKVTPAMKFYAVVSDQRTRLGSGAGYGRARRQLTKMHTLRLGYGDGFFRSGAPFAEGNLCMDACIAAGEAQVGREVLVLGDVASYALAHGTTPYEVLVRLGKCAEKTYV